MRCNVYLLPGDSESRFLSYGEGDLVFPEKSKVTLDVEDVDPSLEEYRDLALLDFEQLRSIRRTPDKILSEHGISSYSDICNAYFLVRSKSLNASKKVRDLVVEKYGIVIELVKSLESNDIRRTEEST